MNHAPSELAATPVHFHFGWLSLQDGWLFIYIRARFHLINKQACVYDCHKLKRTISCCLITDQRQRGGLHFSATDSIPASPPPALHTFASDSLPLAFGNSVCAEMNGPLGILFSEFGKGASDFFLFACFFAKSIEFSFTSRKRKRSL